MNNEQQAPGATGTTPHKKRKILFPGSFDPFTIGHQSLVSRGLAFADEILIAIGINEQKKGYFPVEERIAAIRALYENDPRVEVCTYDTLTVDLARQTGANIILRGIRSVIDFEYEKNIVDVNRSISGIETIFLLAEPEHAHISSSVVRELLHFGKDVKMFIPPIIQDRLLNKKDI